MFNWKKKIDDQEETEKRDRERREAEQKARQLATQEANESQKLRNFQAKFVCHICKTPATEPRQYNIGTREPFTDDSGFSMQTDWNTPADLWKCTKCNKWTCAEHIHKGICQTCAEKM